MIWASKSKQLCRGRNLAAFLSGMIKDSLDDFLMGAGPDRY